MKLITSEEDDDDENDVEKPDRAAATADDVAEEGDNGDAEGQVSRSTEQFQKRPKNDSMELVEYSPDELRSVDKEMLNAEITQLEEDIGKAKPNLNVLAEYRRREAEFLDRARDMETVTNQRDAAKKRYDDLRKVRLDEFMAGFSAISSKLKEMYQVSLPAVQRQSLLTLPDDYHGRKCRDRADRFHGSLFRGYATDFHTHWVLTSGVVLSIMPPKKSWRAIANLSGGEKTLASLALVFALHVFKPTPLYFMDEIDAALDFKNVSIVANYIQSKTQAAQL